MSKLSYRLCFSHGEKGDVTRLPSYVPKHVSFRAFALDLIDKNRDSVQPISAVELFEDSDHVETVSDPE